MDNQAIFKRHSVLGLFSIISLSSPFSAYATPWLDAGDVQLRHELQLLSDGGMLNTPLTTWPLATKDIHSQLKSINAEHPIAPKLQQSYNYINKRLEDEDYGSSFKVGFTAHAKTLLIRDFSGKGREEANIFYDGQWGNPILDMRLKVAIANKSNHPSDKSFRFDDSYLASSFGNWKFTVGQQSRWWGPGWDGSLILSNNARPVPSISLDRIEAKPFENKYLSWMGPWKLNVFAGKLESNRAIPNAKLLGARLTFKPTPDFEIGLSRTAQWGGTGRPQTLSSLFNSIIGQDNFTATDAGKKTEPGNQLAGMDFRWKSPFLSNKPFAVYGQLIGEDEAGYLPSKNIALLGLETWKHSSFFKGSLRAYFELSDTSVDFFQGKARNNTAYNHSIYTSGYRYQDLSLGHSIDSDSRLYSTGVLLSKKNGDFWRVWAKHAKLNNDNRGKNPIASNTKKWTAIGVSLDRHLDSEKKLNLGLQLITQKSVNNDRKNNIGISIGYTRSF